MGGQRTLAGFKIMAGDRFANSRLGRSKIIPRLLEVLALVAVLFVTPGPAHSGTVQIDPGVITGLERSTGVAQGRNLFCTLGYNNCYTVLTELGRRPLSPRLQETVVIIPPSSMTNPVDGVSLVTFPDIMARPEGTVTGTEPLRAPPWAALTERDKKLYDDIWSDGELNISYFLGYRDLGVTRNAKEVPDLFMYGVYALTFDKWRRFGLNWMMSFDRIDEYEWVAEVSLGPDRLVRIRLVDPHVFCESEESLVEQIEREEITRNGSGLITGYNGDGAMVRDLGCELQSDAASEVRSRFLAALDDPTQDLVIYDGHSRFGDGPDFGMFSRPEGKIAAEEFIAAVVASPARMMNLSSCSGMKNYGAMIEGARTNGKTMVWNANDPDFLNGLDDALLFIQSLFEGRSMGTAERFMNLSHAVGNWSNTVNVGLPLD